MTTNTSYKICSISIHGKITSINDSCYHTISDAVYYMLDTVLFYKCPRDYEPLDMNIQTNCPTNCQSNIGIFKVEMTSDTEFIPVSQIIIRKSDIGFVTMIMGEEVVDKYLSICRHRDMTIPKLCQEVFGPNPSLSEIENNCNIFVKTSLESMKKFVLSGESIENFEFHFKELASLFVGLKLHEHYYERLAKEIIIPKLSKELHSLNYYCKFNTHSENGNLRLYFNYVADKSIVDSCLTMVKLKLADVTEDENPIYILKKFCRDNYIKEYSSLYKCMENNILTTN